MTDCEKLRAFAQDVMAWWPEFGDIECADLQDLAEKHGLLKLVTMSGPCDDESCSCADLGAEFPTTCYRRTPLLTGKES